MQRAQQARGKQQKGQYTIKVKLIICDRNWFEKIPLRVNRALGALKKKKKDSMRGMPSYGIMQTGLLIGDSPLPPPLSLTP